MFGQLFDDEYFPDYALLVVRDVRSDVTWAEDVPAVLEEQYGLLHGFGSFARSGDGWLFARASKDGYARVTLDAAETGPVFDATDGWSSVVETPYLSTTGRVGLDYLIACDIEDALELGAPGYHRVRVRRRAAEDGDEWHLTFWPESAPRLPQWLRREEPPSDGDVADDLAHLVTWSGGCVLDVTSVSELLLVPEDAVREGLEAAVRNRVLTVDEISSSTFTAVPLPREEPEWEHHQEPQTLKVGPPWDGSWYVEPTLEERIAALPPGTTSFGFVSGGPPDYVPPLGAPPRAGIVTYDGDIYVALDESPVRLASLGVHAVSRAFETPYGIAVLGHKALLVGFDGSVKELTAESGRHGALSGDGRLLAVQEDKYGRWPKHRTHLFDLSSDQSWILPDHEARGLMAGAGGHIHFQRDEALLRWLPDEDPVPVGLSGIAELDPETGWSLRWIGPQQVVITREDGSAETIDWPEQVRLAPGGRVISYGFHPNRLTVHERGAQRFIWLPIDARTDDSFAPAWEDEDHVVISLDSPSPSFGGQALRVDVREGSFEAVPFNVDAGYRPTLIVPLRRLQL